jgi:predicted nucleotidyltransferase
VLREPSIYEAIRTIAASYPGLELLVLFGSRARGDAMATSDWDLGYLGAIDADALLLALVDAAGTERIDLVDLARASGLIRYRAARDGQLLFEGPEGSFERFQLQAVRFWCDVQPILQAGYDDLLARLGR